MSTRNAKWTNKDGLYVGFGTRQVEVNTGTFTSSGGPEQEFAMKIYGPRLNDAVAAADLENAAVIPQGALIQSATLFVTTAFAGSNAVLDIGVYNASTNAVVDDDGIDAAIAVGSLGAGAVVACDGAVIGALAASPGYKVAASYDTAAFTAGEATLVIKYLVPQA